MRNIFLNTTAMGVAALMGASAFSGSVQAQDISALEARVAELEAEAEAPRFSFTTGDHTTITVYGFVRAEAFYDFDFEQGDTSNFSGLSTDTIVDGELVPGNETDGTFNTSVRVSRLGVRSSTETDIGTIQGQLEYDLFGSNGTAELRLRHANIRVAGFTIGQDWTNFMPIGQYPTTADFNGPVGITFARVPQLRYTGSAGAFTYSVSVEDLGDSADPAVTGALQYSHDLFTARVAVLAGTQRDGLGLEDDIEAITLSGTASLWQGGHLGATYVNGNGLGFLLIGGGETLVAGEANNVEGFTLEARHDFGLFNIGVVYGEEEYENGVAGDIQELDSLFLNAFWTPTDNFTLGVEYIEGSRTDFDGTELDAERVGASVTFTF